MTLPDARIEMSEAVRKKRDALAEEHAQVFPDTYDENMEYSFKDGFDAGWQAAQSEREDKIQILPNGVHVPILCPGHIELIQRQAAKIEILENWFGMIAFLKPCGCSDCKAVELAKKALEKK